MKCIDITKACISLKPSRLVNIQWLKTAINICHFLQISFFNAAFGFNYFFYPFRYQRRVHSTFDQNFDFKIRREHQKISFERRAYESVDVGSLFWVISHRFDGRQYSGTQRVIDSFDLNSLFYCYFFCFDRIYFIVYAFNFELTYCTHTLSQFSLICEYES